EEALERIAQEGARHERIVGWSLGGQLVVRAIAEGRVRPASLVLIAAPFQFVETPEVRLGMKRDQYDKFRNNYARNPERTLNKAWELVAKDDARADSVRRYMEMSDRRGVLAADWLAWLDR